MEKNIGADAAKLAGLQIDTLQKVRNGQITLEHWEWFNKLNRVERDNLAGVNVVVSRFSLLSSLQFTVPKDYNHPTQLASFAKENRKKFYFYNDNITDRNFAKVTNKLVPGKTYEAKIFKITKRVTSEDCLAFRKKTQKAIFVGAQGISVVWQQAKEQFPKEWTVSFDEKDAFWRGADGRYGVPGVFRRVGGAWDFDLGRFEGDWDDGDCLLCLFDLSA